MYKWRQAGNESTLSRATGINDRSRITGRTGTEQVKNRVLKQNTNDKDLPQGTLNQAKDSSSHSAW